MTTVDEYDFAERARLQNRLQLFLARYDPLRAADIISRTLDLRISEALVFEKMCSKYHVDLAAEEADAKECGVFPGQSTSATATSGSSSSAHSKIKEHLDKLQCAKPVYQLTGADRERIRSRVVQLFEAAKQADVAAEKIDVLLGANCSEEELLQRLAKLLKVDVPADDNAANQGESSPSPEGNQQQQEQPEASASAAAAAAAVNATAKATATTKAKEDDQEEQHALVSDYYGANKNRLRMRVTLFYEVANPDALEKVEGVLLMDETEETIFRTLTTRYKIDPAEEQKRAIENDAFPCPACPGDPGGPVSLYSAKDVKRFSKRLQNFFDKHNPAGAAKLPAILDMDNSERQIMRTLCKKYAVSDTMPLIAALAAEELESYVEKLLPEGAVPRVTIDLDAVRRQVEQQQRAAAAAAADKKAGGSSSSSGGKEKKVEIPVASYDEAGKKRLKARLTSFFNKRAPKARDLSALIDRTCESLETENTIMERICNQFSVDVETEQLEARFLGVFPVICYSGSARTRFQKRVTAFYTNHAPKESLEEALKKVPRVLLMTTTEKQIMATLTSKYSVPTYQEREEAEAISAMEPSYPVAGCAVCLYPEAEKHRLRQRVSAFYTRHGSGLTADSIAAKAAGVTGMENTEAEIMATLTSKYNVDPATEAAEAKALNVLPMSYYQ